MDVKAGPLIDNVSSKRINSPLVSAEDISCAALDQSRTKEEIIEQLFLMKEDVIQSLRMNTPLSKLHEDLDKRSDVDYKDLLDWRLENYPSVLNIDTDVSNASYDISEILKEWYSQSQDIKVPLFQYTDEDFAFSTYWGNKSINYSTKLFSP